MHRFAVACLAAAVLAAPAASRGQSTALWPTKQWATATPAAMGVSGAVLDSIDAEISSGRYGYVDRMLVIRHGRVVFDKSYKQDYAKAYADSVHVYGALNPHDWTGPYNYYNPWWHPFYHGSDLHSLQSVTKTVTSIVIGTAIARGDFPGLDKPVLSFFNEKDVANVDARKRRMTVRHLITMTSGFDWNENLPYADPKNTATAFEESHDWVKFVMDRPMSDEPGARFNYNSGATEVLAYIFRKATGTDIEEYAAKNLFAPLGIERWFWKRAPEGLADTEGGLYLEARDLAKLWYLFLENGQWDGKRILTPEWVKESISPAIATSAAPNAAKYGLAWWLYPSTSDPSYLYWSGSGFGGQFPVVMTKQDMVVVFNAWNILPGRGGFPARRMIDRIAAGVTP